MSITWKRQKELCPELREPLKPVKVNVIEKVWPLQKPGQTAYRCPECNAFLRRRIEEQAIYPTRRRMSIALLSCICGFTEVEDTR